MRRRRSSRVGVRLACVALAVCLAAAPAASEQSPAQQTTASPALAEADRLLDEASKAASSDRARAIALAQQALAIREKQLGSSDPAVADALYTVGMLLRGGGDNAAAGPSVARAADILARTNPDSADLAAVLNTLGQIRQSLGDFEAAQAPFERALTIREKVLGAEDPAVATSLNNLALLFHTKGEYARALPLYERALAIREKKLPPDSPLVAQSVNNLAQLHSDRGEYVPAKPLFERALAAYEKARGPDHPDVAAALNNLGLLLTNVGDDQAAEPVLRRALAIREKALGPDHQLVAQSQNNLGLLYEKRAEYAKAEPLFVQSLAAREKALGPDHPDVARALNNLAVCYQEQGQLDRAEPLYGRALAITERRFGAANRLTIEATNNLAVLYLLRGQLDKAEPLYQRSVTAAEQALGPQHPLLVSALSSLAVFYQLKGDLQKAVETQARATSATERNLALLVAAGSEQQKRRYFATLGDQTDITLSLHFKAAPANREAARLGAFTVLQRKGRVLDAMSRGVEALRASLDPGGRDLLDRLSATRGRLAALVLEDPRNVKAAADANAAAETARLEREQEQLESAISGRSAAFRAESRGVSLDAVQGAVPADSALVEIALYRPFNPKATRILDRFSAPRYVAYVIRPAAPVQWIELGDAAGIDALAGKLRLALRNSRNTTVKVLAQQLNARVFAPVQPLLGGAVRVFVSPDGLLNLVPFAALADANGRYQVERYTFSYLTSGRDLLRAAASHPTAPPLVIANPAFDLQITSPTTSSANRGVDLTRASFNPLPGTAGEAQALSSILRDATVLTGAQATEKAVKSARAPSVLHIATHGFFLGGETAGAGAGSRLLVMDAASAATPDTNPLLRSGLAFAGANTRDGGDGEDGILLALEASGLDLYGTRLVVLSACETGVGEVHSGDGVYGLRRALVLAGAESQVMTLWQVSDAATRDLMVAFYRKLQAGAGRADALRAVQLEMLRGTPRRHPFYWASFIQSGQWTPITEMTGGAKPGYFLE